MTVEIEIELIKESIGYSSFDLVKRAVRNTMPHASRRMERWVAVMDVFTIGSTSAKALCRAYGLDPHERIGRNREDEE